jgi:hypothetical protein
MEQPQIRYDYGAAYERMMGAWSRLAGEIFLDWLAPPPGLRWIDIGCGSGALPSCSSNAVRQPRFRGLIRLRRSYLLRAHDLQVGWSSFIGATLQRFLSAKTTSMRL